MRNEIIQIPISTVYEIYMSCSEEGIGQKTPLSAKWFSGRSRARVNTERRVRVLNLNFLPQTQPSIIRQSKSFRFITLSQ